MTRFLRYAARSDVGMVRKANEDSGYAGRTLLVVADGMGGHAAGELASATVVATLAELDSEELPAEDVLTALDDAMITSAERIAQFIQADPSRAGMGTTLTAVLWRGGRIALIHVGDSRAYLLREGQLTQISHDHTYVQTLVEAGRITAEQARQHPKRNLLLRAIDGTGAPEGETSIREARVGDRYLLCSDGLCGVVADDVLQQVLQQVPDPTAAVTELVDLALAEGAPDNVTAVVADLVEVADDEQEIQSALGGPVVVGAAGDQRNRAALPGLMFPDDVWPDDVDPVTAGGPVVAGGLAARSQSRSRAEPAAAGDGDAPAQDHTTVTEPVAAGAPAGSVGAAIASGDLPVGTSPGAPSGAAPTTASEAADSRGWVRRRWRGLTTLAAVAAVLIIGSLGFLWWLSSQWFVGGYSGYVAVFQGIPQQFAGIPLSRVDTRTAVPVGQLPLYDQTLVGATIEAADESEARQIVSLLEVKAGACAAQDPPLGCPEPIPGLSDPTTGSMPTQSSSPVAAGIAAGRSRTEARAPWGATR